MLSPNQESHGGSRNAQTQAQIQYHASVSSAEDVKPTDAQIRYQEVDVKTSSAHQQVQYHNSEMKTGVATNSLAGNFLAQGHHPRSLATEGGGVWDWGK